MNHFLLPLAIPIVESQQLKYLISGIYVIIGLLICFIEMQEAYYKILILLGLYFSCWHNIKSVATYIGYVIIFDKKNQFYLRDRHAVDQKLVLLGSSFVHPAITILCFRMNSGQRCQFCLLYDNVDPHNFRRLRVRLQRLKAERVGT